MSQEYHVGDVSTLLQSPNKPKKKEKNINKKLQNLFSPTSQVSAVPKVDGVNSEAKKTKKKKKELKGTLTSDSTAGGSKTLGSLKRKNKDEQSMAETGVEQENVGRVKKKKKSDKSAESYKSSQDQGFSPPAGIVHESLLGGPKKKVKKRKRQPELESEDETPSKQRRSEDGASKKKMTRKRRDRMAHSTDHRTIFVGNLPVTVKKKKLMNLLKEYGTIESIRYRCYAPNDPNVSKRLIAIKQNLHPDRNNCVAYVCFESPESAKKALKCNGRTLDGLHLRVDMAARDQMRDIKKSIFVGNLPFGVEEEAIRNHFEDCGTINNVRIVRDSKTSLGKGFCYVSFTDTDAVAFALRLNDSRFAGRQLRVMQCQPNPTKSIFDKRKESRRTRRPMKKGFRPSVQGLQPIQVIDAGKDWKKSTHGTVEEEPKKTKFQEKFEKTKQHRIEAGETFKKLQKRMSEKNVSKDKNKDKSKINSPPQIKAGSHTVQENNTNKLKKAGVSSSQEKKQVSSKHKKAESHGNQENNTKKLKRAGLNSSEEKKQNSNIQKNAESQKAQENVTNKVKSAELNSLQEKKEDSNKQNKAGYHSSLKMKRNADREKKAKLKSLKQKTTGSDKDKGNDKTEAKSSQHLVAGKSSHKSRTFVNKSKFASSRNSESSAAPGSSKFSVPGKAKTFRNKEKISGDKFRPLSGAKHLKFDESGKRSEYRKPSLNQNKTKFPQPPALIGNTSKTGKHIYFD